jgi:hypothetical protein
MDIAEIDLPAVGAVRVLASGEIGHGLSNRGRAGIGEPLEIEAAQIKCRSIGAAAPGEMDCLRMSPAPVFGELAGQH